MSECLVATSNQMVYQLDLVDHVSHKQQFISIEYVFIQIENQNMDYCKLVYNRASNIDSIDIGMTAVSMLQHVHANLTDFGIPIFDCTLF